MLSVMFSRSCSTWLRFHADVESRPDVKQYELLRQFLIFYSLRTSSFSFRLLYDEKMKLISSENVATNSHVYTEVAVLLAKPQKPPVSTCAVSIEFVSVLGMLSGVDVMFLCKLKCSIFSSGNLQTTTSGTQHAWEVKRTFSLKELGNALCLVSASNVWEYSSWFIEMERRRKKKISESTRSRRWSVTDKKKYGSGRSRTLVTLMRQKSGHKLRTKTQIISPKNLHLVQKIRKKLQKTFSPILSWWHHQLVIVIVAVPRTSGYQMKILSVFSGQWQWRRFIVIGHRLYSVEHFPFENISVTSFRSFRRDSPVIARLSSVRTYKVSKCQNLKVSKNPKCQKISKCQKMSRYRKKSEKNILGEIVRKFRGKFTVVKRAERV